MWECGARFALAWAIRLKSGVVQVLRLYDRLSHVGGNYTVPIFVGEIICWKLLEAGSRALSLRRRSIEHQ